MTKISNWISKHKNYFILSALVTTLCILTFAMGGVWPFGKNTLGCYDFYHQCVDITNNIFNVFSGRSGALFTFDLAGGTALFGTVAYTCLSPFTLLLILGGPSNVLYMFPLMLVAKLITVACVMYYFVNRYFSKVQPTWAIIITLMYTFSGYTLMTITFPTWIDFMIYMPLLFMAFKRMERTGKLGAYALVMTMMIVTSFNIGIFALVYMLLIIFVYIFLVAPKEQRKHLATRVVMAYAIAVFATLFITVPSLLQVMHSSRVSSLTDALLYNPPLRNLSYKLGHLLPDLILIVASIVYLAKSKLRTASDKFYLYSLVIVLLPVLIDEVNVMLNLSNYAMYCNRIGFVYTFVFTYITLQLMQSIDVTTDEIKNNKVLNVIAVLCIIVHLFLCWALGRKFSSVLVKQSISWRIVFLTTIILCVMWLMLGLILLAKKLKLCGRKQAKTLFMVIISILLVTQSTIYMAGNTMAPNGKRGYTDYTATITADDPYSRVKLPLNNGQLSMGVASSSAFNSQSDRNAVNSSITLGYGLSHNIRSAGNTAFADMLMGLDWEISDKPIDLPYLQKVQSNSNSTLYRNTLSLHHAYWVDGLPKVSTDYDKITNQNIIYKTLSGDEHDLITTIDYTANTNYLNFKFNNVRAQAQKSGLALTTTGDDANIVINYTNVFAHSQIVYLECVVKPSHTALLNSGTPVPQNMIMLKYLPAMNGDTTQTLTYTLEVPGNTKLDELKLYVLDYDKLTQVYNKLSANAPTVKYTQDSITITADSVGGKYLVVNHPMINGYQYTLNGASATPLSFAYMSAFDVQGCDQVNATIKYTYPYYNVAIICLIVGLIAVALLALSSLYYNSIMSRPAGVISGIFVAGISIMVVLYIALPVLAGVYKIVRLII